MSTQRFIARVSYRSNRRRVARVYLKLQYGAVYALTETLARAWATGSIDWFRIDTIKPGEVTNEIRTGLKRWQPALAGTTARTRAELFA